MAKGQEKAKKSQRSKNEKPKKAAKEAEKKAGLSQEYVVDSDDEDAAPEDKKVKKVTVSAPKESKSKVKSTTKKEKPAPAPAPAPVKESSSDEDESESESEDESSDEDEVQSPPPKIADQLPAKVNGVKRSSEEQSSDESSEESTSNEEEEEGPAAKKAKVDSSEESEDGDNSDEEEPGDGEDANSDRQEQIPRPKPAAQGREPKAASSLPAKPFVPPSGYSSLEIPSTATVPADSLGGKQIWHITAPAGVPLSSIAEVSLDALQSGKSVLSHKGADYILNEEQVGDANPYIYLPGQDGYVAAPQRVSKTLHLQQSISLPNLTRRQANPTEGSAAAADVAEAAVSTVRPQPKGLRMRWKPLGFGSGEPGMPLSDSEDEQDRSKSKDGLQFPKALGAHGGSKPMPNKNAEVPTKKQKKKRKDQQQDLIADSKLADDGVSGEAVAGAEVSHQQGSQATLAVSPAKKAVMPETVVDADGDVPMADEAEPKKISKEDKAKRKEEKRKRKEAKAKAKETAI